MVVREDADAEKQRFLDHLRIPKQIWMIFFETLNTLGRLAGPELGEMTGVQSERNLPCIRIVAARQR